MGGIAPAISPLTPAPAILDIDQEAQKVGVLDGEGGGGLARGEGITHHHRDVPLPGLVLSLFYCFGAESKEIAHFCQFLGAI